MYTPTTENYVKRLHELEAAEGSGRVPTGRLAKSLGVSPGTATLMVKSLAGAGLVDYESYGGVRLTGEGRRLALDVLRRHRLVELFLVDVLGLDWADVHAEAEVLEHAVSDKVLERLDALLGRPTVDPHGDPIPDASGALHERALRRLDACRVGETAEVVRTADQSPSFLRFLKEKGLMPGARVTVRSVDRLADALELRPARRPPVVVGTSVARKLLVK